MNKLFLVLLLVGCVTMVIVPQVAEGQEWRGGWGGRRCYCRYRCYYGEYSRGRCGYNSWYCCRGRRWND